MPREATITHEQVAAVADAIKAEGGKPTSGRRLIELIDGRDPLLALPNFPAQKRGLLPAAKEAAC